MNRGGVEKLFKAFDKMLKEKGYITQQGSIIDASFIEVHKQRNKKKMTMISL